MFAKSSLDRSIAERAITVVDEELIRRGLVHLRMAIVGMAVSDADGLVREVPLQVIDHYEIEQSIVVDVDPGTGNGPERAVLGVGLVESGFRRHIGEGAVAIVVVERVAVDASDENIFVAVVVVIADRNAGVVARAGQSGLCGDVGEVTLAVVFEEAVVVLGRIFLERLQVRAVSEEDVELAVVVVIENGYASGHGFRGIVLGAFVAVKLELNRLECKPDRTLGRS